MNRRLRSVRTAVSTSTLVLSSAIAWLAVGAIAPRSAHAAAPSLGSISPYGAQRGTEAEITFNGERLDDAQEIFVYYPGIEVKKLEVVNDKSVKTTLAIAPDCRPGIHAFRVRTASGISNLRTFMVGTLPEVAEVEPNSEFDQPQAVAMNSTVTGVVQNEDVDYYLIEAKKDQRISVEVEGIRLGNTFFDPYVAIMDMERFELVSSDDAALVWQDGVASIIAPADGKYVVQIRESAYGGSGACTYRLHIGHFPRPSAILPAGGRPGETLQIKWLGDVAGIVDEEVALPTQIQSNFGLFRTDDQGMAPSSCVFRLSDLGNLIEQEPNNAPPEAQAFEAPLALNGVISEAGDIDYFKFAAKKDQTLDVRVHAREIRSPLDPVLNILRASNSSGVAGNDDSGSPDSYIRFKAPEDGEFLIQIRDHLNQGGSDYSYRVELTTIKPELTMGLPERTQYIDTTVSVPQGNRTAFLVSASRANFGGDLNVTIDGLPAGMTVECPTMPANQSVVPVLLTAAADAAPAGSLSDVVGRPVDENLGIEGHLSQKTSLVRGQNNVRVWDHEANRMALALTEKVPFTIEIVQPKVPLVRNGRMDLKVVAHRDEGFTAPISIAMLYNPPGVGSASTATIPEGQNEAVLPLNANGGAEIRTWKIAVTGSATVGNGGVLVSSQLADLEVADQFFQFQFETAAVEQGKQTDVVVKVTMNRELPGPTTVELLGLPNEVTTTPFELVGDTAEMVFPVMTTANSPAGKHKTLICRAVVTMNEEPVTHMLGTGELRIDTPLPPKPDAPPAPKVEAKPQPMQPMEKRLTRLETLRLEREEAKKAAAAAAEAKAKEEVAAAAAAKAAAAKAAADEAKAQADAAKAAAEKAEAKAAAAMTEADQAQAVAAKAEAEAKAARAVIEGPAPAEKPAEAKPAE
jgi:hypothetical protein